MNLATNLIQRVDISRQCFNYNGYLVINIQFKGQDIYIIMMLNFYNDNFSLMLNVNTYTKNYGARRIDN